MHLDDRAGLPADELAELRRQLAALVTLQDVVRWGLSARPPHDVVEVIVQDEFTHDVVVGWRDHLHLVFDTT